MIWVWHPRLRCTRAMLRFRTPMMVVVVLHILRPVGGGAGGGAGLSRLGCRLPDLLWLTVMADKVPVQKGMRTELRAKIRGEISTLLRHTQRQRGREAKSSRGWKIEMLMWKGVGYPEYNSQPRGKAEFIACLCLDSVCVSVCDGLFTRPFPRLYVDTLLGGGSTVWGCGWGPSGGGRLISS